MISEELLSEVLAYGVMLKPHKEENNEIWFEYEEKTEYSTVWSNENINVYELAHKCKKWAYDLNYILSSNIHKDFKFTELHNTKAHCIVDGINMLTYREFFEAETEPEAIFKACQWVLENK